MKRSICFAAITAAVFAATGASAATLTTSGAFDLTDGAREMVLRDVQSVSLSFDNPNTSVFRGNVRWSASADGFEDDQGPSNSFTENSYDGGDWRATKTPSADARAIGKRDGTDPRTLRTRVIGPGNKPENSIFIDFEGRGEIVYLWLNTRQGEGTVNYTATHAVAETAPLTPVPLPAGAWLLVTALGAIAFLRRRRTA